MNGTLVFAKSLRGRNRNVRTMFQNARLLPWDNVLRNVGLGLNKKDWRQKAEKGEAEKVQQLASTH